MIEGDDSFVFDGTLPVGWVALTDMPRDPSGRRAYLDGQSGADVIAVAGGNVIGGIYTPGNMIYGLIGDIPIPYIDLTQIAVEDTRAGVEMPAPLFTGRMSDRQLHLRDMGN
ncbi:hypothetical protein CMI47_20985 [Candidatus Pacearchaeota archaeon]|nr:hypothetical protein [Candidatus Pacearchaeota archaeon]|tara:strand:+ start:1888 stop:2223 length:336 start_codon:yes stop_codon:yes gene_type:complete